MGPNLGLNKDEADFLQTVLQEDEPVESLPDEVEEGETAAALPSIQEEEVESSATDIDSTCCSNPTVQTTLTGHAPKVARQQLQGVQPHQRQVKERQQEHDTTTAQPIILSPAPGLQKPTNRVGHTTLTLATPRGSRALQPVLAAEQELGKVLHEQGPSGVYVPQVTANLCRQYNRAAMRLISNGAMPDARQLLDKAQVLSEPGGILSGLPQLQQRLQAITLNNLGCYHRQLGHPHKALEALRQAASIEKVLFGQAGQQQSSAVTGNKSLEQGNQTLPKQNPSQVDEEEDQDPASTLLNLSTVLSSLGRHEPALGRAQEAIAMLCHSHGIGQGQDVETWCADKADSSARSSASGTASGTQTASQQPAQLSSSTSGAQSKEQGGDSNALSEPHPQSSQQPSSSALHQQLQMMSAQRQSVLCMAFYNQAVELEHLARDPEALRSYTTAAVLSARLFGRSSNLSLMFQKAQQAYKDKLLSQAKARDRTTNSSTAAAPWRRPAFASPGLTSTKGGRAQGRPAYGLAAGGDNTAAEGQQELSHNSRRASTAAAHGRTAGSIAGSTPRSSSAPSRRSWRSSPQPASHTFTPPPVTRPSTSYDLTPGSRFQRPIPQDLPFLPSLGKQTCTSTRAAGRISVHTFRAYPDPSPDRQQVEGEAMTNTKSEAATPEPGKPQRPDAEAGGIILLASGETGAPGNAEAPAARDAASSSAGAAGNKELSTSGSGSAPLDEHGAAGGGAGNSEGSAGKARTSSPSTSHAGSVPGQHLLPGTCVVVQADSVGRGKVPIVELHGGVMADMAARLQHLAALKTSDIPWREPVHAPIASYRAKAGH